MKAVFWKASPTPLSFITLLLLTAFPVPSLPGLSGRQGAGPRRCPLCRLLWTESAPDNRAGEASEPLLSRHWAPVLWVGEGAPSHKGDLSREGRGSRAAGEAVAGGGGVCHLLGL